MESMTISVLKVDFRYKNKVLSIKYFSHDSGHYNSTSCNPNYTKIIWVTSVNLILSNPAKVDAAFSLSLNLKKGPSFIDVKNLETLLND